MGRRLHIASAMRTCSAHACSVHPRPLHPPEWHSSSRRPTGTVARRRMHRSASFAPWLMSQMSRKVIIWRMPSIFFGMSTAAISK